MYEWIFGVGLIFTFYNAWGGGANDCANSFATSVGSKTLTLKQAIIIASIFEFGGAVLMGSHVTDTVRKKIVELDIFNDNPGALMFGMLCANLSSAIWLTIATYFKWPVSTTHSIIGSIVGFSLAYGGSDAVNWKKVMFILLSWVASPFIAGIFSLTFFMTMKHLVFKRQNPYDKITKLFPILTFITFFINSLFIIYKGSPQLELDELEIWKCLLISIGIGLFTSLISVFIYLPYAKKKVSKFIETKEKESIDVRTDSYKEALNESVNNLEETDLDLEVNKKDISELENLDLNNNTDEIIDNNIKCLKRNIDVLENKKYVNNLNKLHQNAFEIDEKSDKLCSWLQIFTSCFSSFAHGSNDVANAIAPLATIYSIYRYETIEKKTDVPIWILVLGGVGIVFGLATWGYKIINRMGKDITKISPSRGFIIELAAALTVIIASRTEIPVSTTHCQVGSIVGCGLSDGLLNIQWKLIRGIVYSWLITLPVTGLLSAGLFSYGYYSPHESEIFSVNITTS